MSVVGKALWFIESNLSGPLTLNAVAEAVAVTPSHLARAFAETTGHPVMRYVWGRRLTRAAEALAYGADSVLNVALDAGYASPEAFTRAFRAEFGVTPSVLRRKRSLDDITPTPPQQPRSKMPKVLSTPRVEVMSLRRFAGPVQKYDMETRANIPAQWVAYNQAGTRVETATPDDYYGAVFNFSEKEGTFDYLCGQEVAAGVALPSGFGLVTISGRYARFATKGHISTMNAAWAEVYGDWLSRPDYRPRPGPSVEYYPPAFDGMTGEGGFELWVPVA
jgi:AraC family transcriptional regulator